MGVTNPPPFGETCLTHMSWKRKSGGKNTIGALSGCRGGKLHTNLFRHTRALVDVKTKSCDEKY
jgi:hypothetical protein